VAISVVVSILSCVAGLLVSYHYALASGPAITLAAGAAYATSILFGPVSGLFWRLLPQRHRTA
jgi:zinc/manganese transport system permease protein